MARGKQPSRVSFSRITRAAGGHDVPEEDARRRFARSLRNLFELYVDEVDTLHFFDNSRASPHLVFRVQDGRIIVLDKPLYERIRMQVDR